MKKRLSALESPALAGVVKEKNTMAAIAEIKNCTYHGADMIDLHLSCLENQDIESVKKIVEGSKLPILALHYNIDCEFADEEKRIGIFKDAVLAGVQGVDIQGYTFHLPSKTEYCGEDKYSFTKGNPREIVTDPEIISKQCEFIDWVHDHDSEVLLSCHPGVVMNCTQVVELALFLEKRRPDIIKIVTIAETEDDLAESFKTIITLKKELKTPVTYHVSNAVGALSRIVNPLLGGHMIFCVDSFKENSIMEQLDLKSARAAVDAIKKMM